MGGGGDAALTILLAILKVRSSKLSGVLARVVVRGAFHPPWHQCLISKELCVGMVWYGMVEFVEGETVLTVVAVVFKLPGRIRGTVTWFRR